MSECRLALSALLMVVGPPLCSSALRTVEAQDAAPVVETETPADETPTRPEIAAVRKTAEEFVKAFNAGDAKAVAALWTPEGTYSEADGEQIVGRDAIEQVYAEFFQKNPEATIEVTIDLVRVLGPNVAIEEGTSRLRRPDGEDAAPGRYSVLHVRGDDGWRMASVTEWLSDPALAVSLQDIEWLVGDWEVASDEVQARVSYEWNEGKTFLRGRYTLRRGGDIESTGTETIARNPTGGLRSWRFDDSGAFAESFWTRQGKSWLVEGVATLPEGSEAAAIVLLTPLDDHSFLWQSTERSVGDVALPGTRPLKVNRVANTSDASPKPNAGR